MKHFLSILAVVFTLGLGTFAMDAEAAKRLGSGKSMGTQRQANVNNAPAKTEQSAASPTAASAAATPSRSWMGPVAGLAAGLGLAALASHLGFGEELASMVMMGLVAAAIMLAIGFIVRKRALAQQSNAASIKGMQYAYVNPTDARTTGATAHDAPAYKVAMPAGGRSTIGSGIGTSASRIPSDFDTESFERSAKVNFIRLQTASNAGNLDDIQQFTTPEMFDALKVEIAERDTIMGTSEVISLEVGVIDVDEDLDRYLVSVRFTGVIRDSADMQDEPFDEVWHLTKSRKGNNGWVLSGIQQVPLVQQA